VTINIIAAIGLNGELGKDNQLLWKLKSDLQHFKNMTEHKVVVMGSNTYRSIGRALPNRKNIVLSRNKELEVDEGVIVYDSIEKLMDDYSDIDLFIIGGEQIYKQFLPFTYRIYLTIVMSKFPEADTFFPKLDDEWKCVKKHKKLADEDNEFDHWYCVYEL